MFSKASQHRCKLLRETAQGWQELEETSSLTVTRSSLQLRAATTGGLQADLPFAAVLGLSQCSHQLLRVEVAEGLKFAVKCEGREALEKLMSELRNNSYPAIRVVVAAPVRLLAPVIFPSAQDPELHQLVLDLLFKAEFRAFVNEVKTVLTALESGVSE